VWLVNTGWIGGGFGTGKRIKLAHTRAIIDAIHSGALADAKVEREPVFGCDIITECPNVPTEVLTPRVTWPAAKSYDAASRKLAELFKENFRKYEAGTSAAVRAAGPN
jgi:phosphoenolpyruvate carboxykinase (ATP)